jgi:GST-like protein
VATTRGNGYLLYGSRNSGSAAVEAALELTKAPYRIVDAATWRKKDDPKSFARLQAANPLHQVPTLVCPDGTLLTESAAILIHLALAHPRARLLPADASRRGSAIRAMVFIVANCYAAIGVIDYPERWTGSRKDKDANETLRKGARKRLHKLWSLFAEQFDAGHSRFLFGEQLTAADLLAAVVSRWSGARAHLAKKHPALHALVERVEAHPQVAPVIARHWGAGLVTGP